MQPILFSAVGFTSKGKEFPKSITPHNYTMFLTNQGLEFIQLLRANGKKAISYLKELSRGNSQKVLQINSELTDMENCEILTLAWADKSIYYREHHFPDPIVLRAEYF